MVPFITSLPLVEAMSIARRAGVTAIAPDPFVHPAWAKSILVGRGGAMEWALVQVSITDAKVDAFRPKPIIADPTFAMAAANVERGGSAPAAAFAR